MSGELVCSYFFVYFRLGRGSTVGQNQYCQQTSTDPNTPTDFYLRLGSHGSQNTINWIVHLPTTTPLTTLPTTLTTVTTAALTAEAPTTVTTAALTTEAPTTVTMPPEAVVTTNTTNVGTGSANVMSFGICQMAVVVLGLALEYCEF